MTRRGTKLILLLACAVFASCKRDRFPDRPELPQSIAPSWIRKSFGRSEPPTGIPERARPECWKADYASGSAGSAEAWVCGYLHEGSAFDALQRTAAAANTVKFQEGDRLAIVKWNGAPRADTKALVLGIQRAIRSN